MNEPESIRKIAREEVHEHHESCARELSLRFSAISDGQDEIKKDVREMMGWFNNPDKGFVIRFVQMERNTETIAHKVELITHWMMEAKPKIEKFESFLANNKEHGYIKSSRIFTIFMFMLSAGLAVGMFLMGRILAWLDSVLWK